MVFLVFLFLFGYFIGYYHGKGLIPKFINHIKSFKKD